MALALLAMTLLLKRPLRSFGLNRASWPRSRMYMVWFGSVWSVLTLLNYLPNLLQARPEPLGFAPRVFDIVGWLAFKGFLSGTSEEIFFRGLLQTMLVAGWPAIPRLVRGRISLAAIIVALIFAFAHIEFYFSPFTIEYNPTNVVAALVLGVFYGVAYDRTGSLLAPIVAHNYANLAMSLGAWGTVLLFG
jgi:membrane protease YdiL (CAAX protease family)